jgi:hypothetical protein
MQITSNIPSSQEPWILERLPMISVSTFKSSVDASVMEYINIAIVGHDSE